MLYKCHAVCWQSSKVMEQSPHLCICCTVRFQSLNSTSLQTPKTKKVHLFRVCVSLMQKQLLVSPKLDLTVKKGVEYETNLCPLWTETPFYWKTAKQLWTWQQYSTSLGFFWTAVEGAKIGITLQSLLSHSHTLHWTLRDAGCWISQLCPICLQHLPGNLRATDRNGHSLEIFCL